MSECRNIPFARSWVTHEDRRAVIEALDSPKSTQESQVGLLEKEFAAFLGSGAHCVSVSSCLAALQLAYVSYGIGRGDEVIVPAQTHTAAVHAVEWVGARPVFVDCDPRTGNVTVEAIAAAVTLRTRAISVAHFAGVPCDMDRIMTIAEQCSLKVLEDCTLALGARYKGRRVGLFGDVGCFSFHPMEYVANGEGGMLVSRHRDIAEAARKLRALGVERNGAEQTIPVTYDIPALGLDYRMGELQAALGRAQIRHVEENLARRRSNFEMLRQYLQGLPHIRILDATQSECESSHYCLNLVLEEPLAAHRDGIVSRLNAAGIGTSICYPQPVPRMSYYRKKYGYDPADCPCAAEISDHSVALPVGPHMNPPDVSYMGKELRKILKELSFPMRIATTRAS